MSGTNIRIEKLFDREKNAVIIAVDHGMFDGPIEGMINLPETVKKINPDVDGILMSPGMLGKCKEAFNYKGAPIPIVRLNWSTVYCFHWSYNQAETVVASRVRDAVALGAEIILVSLNIGTGDEKRDAVNVEIYCSLMNEARVLGIPVMGEIFPVNTDKLTPSQLHEKVYSGCRILTELGTDMIKTFYTNDFKKVTGSCPVPIFGLGAEKLPTQLDALKLASNEIRDGAKGVVFGRNAIQVKDPMQFQAALIEVVKNNMAPETAMLKFELKD
ncbi:class I fructose-bisphosphate aldolase [Bacteroidota bacterium]